MTRICRFLFLLPQFRFGQQLPPNCQSDQTCRCRVINASLCCFAFFRARKMASTSTVLRTCGLTLYLILQVYATVNNSSQLFIRSLKVGSLVCVENHCKYLLNVSGSEFLGHYPWRLTSEEGAKGGGCEVIYPDYELKEIETTQWFSKFEVVVPKIDGKIYFCLLEKGGNSPFSGKWVHQGVDNYLEPKNDVVFQENEKYS